MNKVLIVEDERIIANDIETTLKRLGYNVCASVASGEEALRAISETRPDIVLMDIKLKGTMDGIETAKRMHEQFEVPIVYLSAHADNDMLERAKLTKPFGYVVKPFEEKSLYAALEMASYKNKMDEQSKDKLKETADALEKTYESLQFAAGKIEQVLGIDQRISEILELHHLIDFIIEKAAQILGAHRCSLMILDMEKQELLIKGAKGLDENIIKNMRIKLGESICGVVARDGNPLLVTDIEAEPDIARKNNSPYRSKSFISVPVKLRDKIIGVFNASDKGPKGEDIFTQTDLKVISMIIQQAAIAIENANYYRELQHLSTTDSLTGLYNHRYFMQVLKAETERSNRYGNALCLLMFDVDDFKAYNDSYGHLEGDRLLKELSRSIKESLRVVDVICRYAGDEFMIILPETHISQGKLIAEKIKLVVSNLRLKRPVTISIGIASCCKDINAYDFILKTDQALYQAKKAGKDGVCLL